MLTGKKKEWKRARKVLVTTSEASCSQEINTDSSTTIVSRQLDITATRWGVRTTWATDRQDNSAIMPHRLLCIYPAASDTISINDKSQSRENRDLVITKYVITYDNSTKLLDHRPHYKTADLRLIILLEGRNLFIQETRRNRHIIIIAKLCCTQTPVYSTKPRHLLDYYNGSSH